MPDESLVFDARVAGSPGIHALVVGVSDYPKLRVDGRFGMVPLQSAAVSAARVFSWLTAPGRRFPVPLQSVRMLVAPSDLEKEAVEELTEASAGLPVPTLDAFLEAALAWRDDVATHKDGVAVFYFAGHGVQTTSRDAVLLLYDFGRKAGGLLRDAVDSAELRAGLAPQPGFEDVARRQLFLIDACRNRPGAFQNYADANPTQVWTPELPDLDDRQHVTFYAAVPGAKAYGVPGQGSIFSEALLHGADRAAAGHSKRVDGALRYPVSASVLFKVTEEYLQDKYGSQLDPSAEGFKLVDRDVRGEFDLHYLDAPPEVELELAVSPAGALDPPSFDRVEIRDAGNRLVCDVPLPVGSGTRVRVPAGACSLEASGNGAVPLRRLVAAQPLRTPFSVQL